MGILDFIKKQFVDVIQWTEDAPGTLAYRYPMRDMEIQNGAQLVVRETQEAVFFDEGQFADKFAPGTHTLTTKTLPIITNLKNWDKAFESPFKSDVYFFSHREQTDQRWGTLQPITVRDPEFGPLRIRAHGIYSYKIVDVEPFWTRLCGTAAQYTTADIEPQLRAALLTSISSFLAKSGVAFIDMAANQEEFSAKLKEGVAPALKEYGLELASFFVQSLSLPEEVEKHLDAASSQRVVGDLRKYTQFQTADSIAAAAENPGGVAGAGVGLGAGIAMGQTMMQGMSGATSEGGGSVEDPVAMIEKLGELHKKGILSQEEFDKKKAELLAKI